MSDIKYLLFSDTHVFPYNEFSQPTADGGTTLLEEHEKSHEWVAELIEKYAPETVVHLGDTVLTHNYLDGLSACCIYKGYRAVSHACDKAGSVLEWLLGNHDIGNDAARIHTLPFIEELVTDLKYDYDHGEMNLYVPFYRDPDQLKRLVDDHCSKFPIRNIFTHNEMLGAIMNSGGILSTIGLNPADYPQCKIYSGHYHHPYEMDNLVMVGSLMYRNFNDQLLDTPRGVVLVNRDDSIVRLENPHTSMYCTLRVESDEQLIKELKDVIHPDRTYLRVVYPEKMDDIVKNLTKDFKKLKPIPLQEAKSSVAVQIEASVDPHQVIEAYLKANPPANINPSFAKYAHSIADTVLGQATRTQRHYARFKSMHLENFLSIQSLDIDLSNPGVWYVDGIIQGRESNVSNGAGKSSISEGIHWILTGQLIRDGCLADDVVHDCRTTNPAGCGNDGKDTLGSLILYSDDHEYQITRTRWHSQYGNDVLFYRDGQLISQGLKETNPKIYEELGCDQGILRHTALLVDSLSSRFTQLGSSERLALFESILQTQVYDRMFEIVHEQFRDCQKLVNKLSTESLMTKAAMDNSESAFKSAQEKFASTKTEIETVIEAKLKSAQDLENKISEINSGIPNYELLQDQLKSKIDGFDQKVTDIRVRCAGDTDRITKSYDPKISAVRQRYAALNTDVFSKYQREIASVNGQYDQLINECDEKIRSNQVAGLVAENLALMKDRERLEKIKSGVCPTCNRPMVVPEEIDNDLVAIQSKIEGNKERMDQMNANVISAGESKKSFISEKASRIRDLESSRDSNARALNNERDEAIEVLRKELDNEKDHLAHESNAKVDAINAEKTKVVGQKSVLDLKIQGFRTQAKDYERQKMHLFADIQSLRSSLSTQESVVNQLRVQVNEYESQLLITDTQLANAKYDLVVLEYWDTGFNPKGCRTWLVNDAVNTLNAQLAESSSTLSDGDVSVSMFMNNGGIEVDVKSQGGAYRKSSSGERRKVDLPIQLGISKLSSKYSGFDCNIKFLDEVDDKLDGATRRRLVELLEKIAEDEGKKIFIASHNKDIKSYVGNVLTMVKDNGVSRISTQVD